jgi:hypothetical protein
MRPRGTKTTTPTRRSTYVKHKTPPFIVSVWGEGGGGGRGGRGWGEHVGVGEEGVGVRRPVEHGNSESARPVEHGNSESVQHPSSPKDQDVAEKQLK